MKIGPEHVGGEASCCTCNTGKWVNIEKPPKKPSERISDLLTGKIIECNEDQYGLLGTICDLRKAICTHLDEQWEKDQRSERK